MTPTQKGIAPHTIELLTDSARKIMREAREKAAEKLKETSLLEQLITLELAKFGIIATDVSVRYENEYDMGAWYLSGNFAIPPTLDDTEAIEAFKNALPQWYDVASPNECASHDGNYELYSRHTSRAWVYGQCSTAIRLESTFTNIY